MNIQPNDVHSILRRVEALERQNRRLKIIGCGLFLPLAVLCAVSASGQQEPKGQSATAKQDKKSHPGFTPVQPRNWKLKDGRLVVFPASVKMEEVDATSLDLPPGTKVIGWEPVPDTHSLLPGYEQRVATIPTVKDKLAALSNAAGILQSQANDLRAQIAQIRVETTEKANLDYVNEKIYATSALPAANFLAIQNLQRDVDDLKRKLGVRP